MDTVEKEWAELQDICGAGRILTRNRIDAGREELSKIAWDFFKRSAVPIPILRGAGFRALVHVAIRDYVTVSVALKNVAG